MLRTLVRKESAAEAAARRTPLFEGLPWPLALAGPVLLAIPSLLYYFNAIDGQPAGVFFAVAFFATCAVFAVWPAFATCRARAQAVALSALALAAAAAGGLVLVGGLAPGAPAAEASLPRKGEAVALPAVDAGHYQLVVHATFAAESRAEISAAYTVKLETGGATTELSGRFQSRHGRSRVGRQSVDVKRAPPEWSRHTVTLPGGPVKASLYRGDGALGEGVAIQLHRSLPAWLLYAGAALVALLGLLASALIPDEEARVYYLGALLTATCGATLGSAWAWVGEPILPLIGACFLALTAGWLLGKGFARLARGLPWAPR